MAKRDEYRIARTTIDRRIRWWTVVATALVFFGFGTAAWYGYWYLWPAYRSPSAPDTEAMARFGSFLQGATGSVWALASVLFIYVAFLGQRGQVLLQQEQLELTKADVEAQQTRLDAEAKLSRKQLFESSFFQLLSAHGRIVEGISTSHGSKELRGRDCFTQWYAQFRTKLFPAALHESGGDAIAAIQPAFNRLYALWRTDLGHYFRSLYNLIKFVKAADRADGRRYTNLVRAQMSDQEVLVLFYNCLTPRGAKFKSFVEDFALLKHLDATDLCDPDHHAQYNNSAYS